MRTRGMSVLHRLTFDLPSAGAGSADEDLDELRS
jgi:hypothetical protein